MIAVIDYDAGNLKNVVTALKDVDLDCVVTRKAQEVENASAVILPGVGAFADAMKNLEAYDLIEPLNKTVQSGKFLLGICLGMQVLFNKSYEDGEWEGLNYLQGEIVRFDTPGLKVPHMGWNNLIVQKKDDLVRNISDQDYVYFVHSYYAKPEHFEQDVLAYADYSVRVPGIVRKENVIGMQFHPEKSAAVGTKLLENFKELIKK